MLSSLAPARRLHGLALLSFALSGEVGQPLVRCIAPAEYDGGLQIFDAAQGPDGLLYFACPEDFAVLCYDGERWRKALLASAPVSLDVDEGGRIWVGSSDAFGYLREAAGGWELVPVAGEVAAGEPERLSFIETRCTSRGVFFLSQELLVLWDGERAKTWRAPADGGFMDVEELGDDVFVLEGTAGCLVLADGELLESDALGAGRILDALCTRGEELVGVWLDEDGLHWLRSGAASETTLRVPELLRGPTYVSDAVLTPGGTLVVASASGVLLVDREGRFQAWLDDETGLPNSLVYSLLVDREGAVWANLSYGIARIDPSTASSFFGTELGLVGTALSFARHEGAAYCGTFEGLFRLDVEGRVRFEQVAAIPSGPVFDLLPTDHGLLLATDLGLLSWDGSVRAPISAAEPLALAALDAGDGDEDAAVVAGFGNVSVLRWKDGAGWTFDAPFQVKWDTDAIVTDEHGFWLHSFDRELHRVPYDGEFGTPVRVQGQWLGMCAVADGILAWDCTRLALLRGASTEPETFAAAAGLDWPELQRSARWVRPSVEDDGRLWLLDPHSLRRFASGLTGVVGAEPDLLWSSPFALEGVQFDEHESASRNGGSVAWLNTHEGLVRLELDRLRPPPVSDPLVWPSTRTGDGTWSPLPAGALPVDSSLRVEVAAAAFDATPTTYRYRLEGIEHDWCEWTQAALKEYTTLPGGEYVLHVQSRKQGRTLGESRLAFAVLAPWFTRWPAVLLGLAALGSLAFGIARWRSARLTRENERLGRLVAERMRDLEAEKALVLEHSAELERVNERLVREIDAREAADRAQREMHERLGEAERLESLGVLAAGIAHDFNNYLTSILGYAQMALDERGARGELAEHLRSVTVISREAAELCSGLLSLAGRTPVQAGPVDLSHTVRGMESLLRTSLKDRGQLRLELAEDVPTIAGDAAHLRRALVNLVINASEACEGRASPVVVRTGSIACGPADLARMHRDGERAAGEYAYVEVEDQGAGMTGEAMRHVFDPFFSTKLVGRGLGLTTVFRIVSSHGGAIDVHSEVGRGTRVRLLFPRCDRVRTTPVEETTAAGGAKLAGRVLVVDDDEHVRKLSALFCRRLGLEVTTAASGRDALTHLAASNGDIDAVLLDLSMPGMDGLQVLAEIRGVRPELPILVVSGYTDRLPREPDGATRFLAKPFSLEMLARELQHALECSPAQVRSTH